ncbi:ABC transporter permease [Crenalkalicoccus roseus]|uniref:ABC transporter permease n=1 Tax=Crenalkalicoccus roseus TaxID=1485588 RepID=UPI0010818D8D|nr:iron ABC transporter permease [Crenalkalicoccus roseus]
MSTTVAPKVAAGPVAPSGGLLRRLRYLEPATLLWLLLVGALFFLVVWPVAELLITSFQARRTGEFTLSNYAAAYGRQRYVDALLNSLALGALAAAISAVMAVPMAWACSRTNMPGRGFAWLTVLAAFIIPPYLGAIGWILLAGPNSGWINQTWSLLTGSEASLVNVYTFWGLALVIALNSYPFIFIFTKSALDLISSEMEDAANILGAGTWTTTLKVTLPLVWPMMLAGIILVFLETIALFGTPAIIGIPARINVVTTQLWQFFEAPVRAEVAAAYAMPLLLITAALIGLQKLLLSRKGYVSQTGKGGERRVINLGPWRWVLFGWCVVVCVLSVVAPMIALVQASFSRAWGRGFSLDNLTLANYEFLLFGHDAARGAIVNTFVFSAASATLAMALALAIAYVVRRNLLPFGTALAFLCMAPFVIPGIVMAIGFYAAYAGPPLLLYGTATLMILAFTTRFLPIAYANGAAGMQMIHPEMEEAVRILGGGRLTAIRSVVAPLLKKALLGGWLLVFILATRELSAAIFLIGPHTRTISVLLYDLSEEGNFEVLSALGGILLVITLVFVGIGMRLIGRDFMLRRSSE